MNMKSKMKSPEEAQSLGLDGNKRLLKKLINEGFQEPLKFFYDTTFDYGEDQEVGPLLFISDKIPSAWRRYIKEHKREKTFAAGNCLLIEEGKLKLAVEMGKGAKSSQLKEVNKQLLRPFASAFFVEDLTSEDVQEDIEDKESSFESDDLEQLIEQTKIFATNGEKLKSVVQPFVRTWEKPLSNLKELNPDDKLIEQMGEALQGIRRSGFQNYRLRASTFVVGLEEEAEGNKELAQAVSSLQAILAELKQLQPGVELILEQGPKLRLVKDPMRSEYPPISDNPFVNFENALNSIMNRSKLEEYNEQLKNFNE